MNEDQIGESNITEIAGWLRTATPEQLKLLVDEISCEQLQLFIAAATDAMDLRAGSSETRQRTGL